jgi:hypothetical protein
MVPQSPLSPEWKRYSEQSAGVVIHEPGVGTITGTLTDHGDPADRSLYVDMFEAEESGNGSGKQLLALLKREGQKLRSYYPKWPFYFSGRLRGFFAYCPGGECNL